MNRHLPNDGVAWALACGAFILGDVTTTTAGMVTPGVVEAHPVSTHVLAAGGLAAMLAVKTVAVGACVALWALAPEPHRRGVPLGLALLGVVVTLSNAAVLAAA